MRNTKLKVAILKRFRYQADLCDETGLTETRLSKIITGRAKPTQEEKKRIAKALEQTSDNLFSNLER